MPPIIYFVHTGGGLQKQFHRHGREEQVFKPREIQVFSFRTEGFLRPCEVLTIEKFPAAGPLHLETDQFLDKVPWREVRDVLSECEAVSSVEDVAVESHRDG